MEEMGSKSRCRCRPTAKNADCQKCPSDAPGGPAIDRTVKPPSFTIRIDGRERETEAHRLSLHKSSLWPDVAIDRSIRPPSFAIRVDGRERETEAHCLSLQKSPGVIKWTVEKLATTAITGLRNSAGAGILCLVLAGVGPLRRGSPGLPPAPLGPYADVGALQVHLALVAHGPGRRARSRRLGCERGLQRIELPRPGTDVRRHCGIL
jgi:hypothetical protein